MLEPCPACGREGRLRWIAKHSGLNREEQGRMLPAFSLVGTTAEQAQQRRAARSAIQEAIQKQTGLYTFYGDFGSGKTLALQVVINELRAQYVEGYYAPFAVIVDHLRQLFETRNSSVYWNRLLEVPVLALDEVSRFDEDRAWIRDKLFVLADTRYRNRSTHLTLFATNDNPTLSLPPSDPVGYLFSRMRESKNGKQGRLCELRGDLRATAKVFS